MSRIVCQFSCGAASAVATKLALAQYGDRCAIINAYLRNEHPDNRREPIGEASSPKGDGRAAG